MVQFKILLGAFLIVFSSLITSCKSTRESKKIKDAEKQEMLQEKEAQKQYDKLVEAHHKRQTDSTKERMEETKKRAEFYNQSKKRSLFQRIFGTRPKHKKPKKKNWPAV